MTKNISYFILLFTSFIFSQKKFNKEFSIKTDNDLYTSKSKDRYYTSGVFLSYRYVSDKEFKKAIKKTYEIQLTQQMFTPYRSNVSGIEQHDRPFAAYLYGSFGISNFYSNESILKLSSQIGVIGSAAFGEETMKFVHKLYGFDLPTDWKYQIANAFALNFEATYIKDITNFSTNYLNVNWINNVEAGTIFTNISTGLDVLIGFIPLKKISKSIAYNGNLNEQNREFFLYIKPILTYNHYDATIQGSFLNTNSPVTYDTKPFFFSTEFGFRFAMNKINIGYSVVLHTKKIINDKVEPTNVYGTININYLFN